MASQITSLMIVSSTIYSGADQRKHQSSASLVFVRGIHRWPGNSQHKRPVTRKMFPFDDVIVYRTDFTTRLWAHISNIVEKWSYSYAWPLFTKKTPSYKYRNPHFKPKTVWRPPHVYNGNPYTNETVNTGPGYDNEIRSKLLIRRQHAFRVFGLLALKYVPDSKIHGALLGPHVGPTNFVIWGCVAKWNRGNAGSQLDAISSLFTQIQVHRGHWCQISGHGMWSSSLERCNSISVE